MATRSGADTLLRERREFMFPTLTTETEALRFRFAVSWQVGNPREAKIPSPMKVRRLRLRPDRLYRCTDNLTSARRRQQTRDNRASRGQTGTLAELDWEQKRAQARREALPPGAIHYHRTQSTGRRRQA